MKRTFCLGVVLAAALSVFGVTSTVTWTLPADWEANVEYTSAAVPSNAMPRLVINGPDFGYPSDPVGAPALPFLPVSIAVAEGSVISNCTVEATWTEVKRSSRGEGEGEQWLRPSIINEPHIVGEAPIYSPEDPQYFGAARYPATPESIGGVQTCAGEAAIVAWVTPYRWNGQSGKLEKATALKLAFTYEAPPSAVSLRSAVRAKLRLKTSAANAYTGVMYVISPPNFKTYWQAYVDYRKTTHPDVEFHIVDTVSDIYNVSPYSGGRDDAQRIHKFLEAKYAVAKAANQKMYAILGAGCAKGNEAYNRNTMIPLRMTVAYSRSYFPSDLYYSCMDKRDNKGEVWDYDNDGYFLGTTKSNSDPEWKIDWQPDIVALRFPVRTTAYLQNVSGSASKSYTAQEQINGLVNKLKIYEGAADRSRTFGGYFRYSVSYHRLFEDVSRGSTDDKVAGEHTFFDGIENMWTANHTAVFEDAERNVRHIHHAYETAYRPLSGTVNNTQVCNNDLEINTHNSHGQEQTAAPFQAYDFFVNGKIQFFMNYANSCLTGKIDTGDVDGHGNLSFAEACILNPNGGAIITFNNTREGYGAIPGYRELMSLAMQIGMIKGFYSLGDGSVYEAFIKGHQYSKNSVGFSGAGGCMAACYVEANVMGDPLAKLKTIASSATMESTVNGFFATTGTLNGDATVNGVSGVVNLNVNTAGNTITLGGGSQFKATGKLTVNGGGTLKWNAPGGVGRNGLTFNGTRGRLVCEGDASRYFGARFSGLDEILVTGYNTTLDFDKTGATRDVGALKFIGSEAGGIAKCNYIRSREGGIFKPDMSIPVANGTLVLQTTNIGGSGNASNTTTPIFTLTNAVLKIAENPHWANEMINRPIWMNGATIAVAYPSFGFGAKVSGSNGMTLRVLGGDKNTVSGSYDAEINGPFRVDVASDAVLKIHVPLTKSSYAGSLVKSGEGRLELRAANTFTGGIALKGGKTVFGKEALTSSACGTVTVEDGATLQIESLPLASVTKLTVRAGGKLILPGDKSTASYQLVDPSVGSLDFAEGALVYNEHDLTTPLKGSATSDGYYMDTSSFLHWQDQDGTWSTDSTGSKWMKGGTEAVSYANGNSVQFPDHGAKTHNIAVSGTVQPGYITFNNSATAYNFTGSGSKISIENLYTMGDTTFEPEVSAGSKAVVTSGKTTFKNLTTASASVSAKGELQVTGALTPATYISKIVFNVTAVPGSSNPIFGTLWNGYWLYELRFYNGSEVLTLPVGTKITAVGKSNVGAVTAGNRNDAFTVTASSNGAITGWTYTSGSDLARLFDGNAGTGWGWIYSGSTVCQKSPSYTITIELGSPMRMFTKYQFRSADNYCRCPKNWTVSVTESKSGSSTTVSTGTTAPSANAECNYSVTYSGASSASVNVSNGGTLYLDGTYHAPITVGADSTLAVTNAAKLTANKGFAMNGNVTLNVNEAGKFGWTEVLHGANLAASVLSKFTLNADDAAAKIEGGNLYVATQGVKKGPYTRAFTGDDWYWNSTGWKGNNVDFGCTWGDAITRMSDNVIVTINNSSTGTLNCAVVCNAIFFTNETDNAQRVRVNGSGAVSCKTLDFSGLKGEITWAPDLGGANVVAGTNRVILLKGVGNAVCVASNGYVSTVGTFASYDIQPETRMHFANAGRAVNMNQLPSQGVLSFDGMTIQSGVQGAFQKQNVTFLVEDGQSLALSDTTGFNARCLASFDVRGGSVTIEPGGAWWFGQNGVTKYNQTGGTFTCNATAGNSVLFGYQGESSFLFDVNVAGGTFAIPNALANIYNPANINIGSNGVFRAKGVTVRDGVTGTVNVNEQGTLEVGASGLATRGATYNLNGGTLAAFESATVGAPIDLGGVGTLAAKAGTELAYVGTVKAENATLNFGRAGYEGMVRLAAIPAGVTNYAVVAGTWDLGGLRPTNNVPVTVLTGKIAVQLTDGELRQAAEGGFKLIKTTLPDGAIPAGHMAVVTSAGTSVTAAGRVEGGYIYLSINYVYPLYGEVKGEGEGGEVEQLWADLDWHDAIGMPFKGEWTDVESAVLSNVLDGVTVVVTNDFDATLAVVNSGTLELIRAGRAASPVAAAIDDSASTGKTAIDFTVNDITVGAETVVKHLGAGALTLANGACAVLWNNLDWPSARISGFSGTAKIRYAGDTTLNSIKYAGAANYGTHGVVSYAQKYDLSGTLQFDYTVTREFAEGLDLATERLVMGNQGNNAQTFRQTGGKILATGSGDVLGSSPTTTSPLLFSHWNNPVTYYLAGGELVATNGVNGSVYFGRDGVPKLYIGGGSAKATLRTNGLVNDSRTDKDKNGSVLELLPNGNLEIGNKGFVLYRNAELRLSGGTFLAYENAEIKSDTSKFTLTANTTSYLAATNGATLTVSKVPTGTGTLVCNPANGSKIVLAGDYSNVTLGGAFTLKLTDAQKSSTQNVLLFRPAEGFDAEKVRLTDPSGNPVVGNLFVRNGYVNFVSEGGFALPIVGEAYTNNSLWSSICWHDSSNPVRTFNPINLNNYSEIILNVHSNLILKCDHTRTLPSLKFAGPGCVDLIASPSQLTLTSAQIETGVTSTNNAAAFTAAKLAANGRLTLSTAASLAGITGSGTLECLGYEPSYANLADGSKWTGTVRYVVNNTNKANLNFAPMGNASSTIEMDGTITATSGAQSYLAQQNCDIGTLRLLGSIALNNGFSQDSGKTYTITYTFRKLTGGGSLKHTATQTFAFSFLDASEFAGAFYTAGTQIGIGAKASLAAGTIAIAGEATIADGRQWHASNGIKVQNAGVLNLAYPRATTPITSAVTIENGGTLNLVCSDPAQTAFPISTSAAASSVVVKGRVVLNGRALRNDAYTLSNGTLTLGTNPAGASVSVNVGGGGTSGITGMLIDGDNYAGVIPVKGANWNQDAPRTDGSAVDRTIGNLKEVLADGSVVTGPMKVRLLAKNVWSAKGHSTPANGDAQMMFGYLDDGTCGTTGAGAGFYVDNIPYTTYDVYVYMGSDADSADPAFVQITAIDAAGTKTRASSWGKSASTHNTVALKENENYCKFTGCVGSSLKVIGAVNGNPLRGGIAAIQIFNTGTRMNTLAWEGGATGGTWDKADANWRSTAGAGTAWTEVADGANVASFDGDTSLTLGEVVNPDVLDIGPNTKSQTREGYVPASSTLLFSGVNLSDVTDFSGDLGGKWVANKGEAGVFHKTVTGDSMTLQFQRADDGYIKCVKLSLAQQGDDVYGHALWAKNIHGGTLGVDFDHTSETIGTASVSTGDNVDGYGIKNLTYNIDRIGNLSVLSAEKFGKPFLVTNGVLTVVAGSLAADVALASGAKLNIVTTDVTNEYVVTYGKIVNGGYDNILVNGGPIDPESWSVEALANGKLRRIVKPGTTPFTYTIAQSGETQWTNAPWLASNWFYVRPEEWTTGTVAQARLTVEPSVTNALVANADIAITTFEVANSGCLTVTNGEVKAEGEGEGEQWNLHSLSVATLDDSASIGKTILGFAPTNVKAGADTVLTRSIGGMLTVAGGGKATINGTANSYEIAANGEVRFVGGKATSVVSGTETEGAVVSYREADFTLSDTKYWTLKLYDGDYVYANVNEFINPISVTGGELVLTNTATQTKVWYGGENVTGKPHSSMAVTGGKITVLCSGVGTTAATCGFLFGQTKNGDTTPSLAVNGGAFDVSGGRFTFWEKGDVTIANGVFSAKGVNKHDTTSPSTLAVNGGGVLSIGSLGLATENPDSFAVSFNGGALHAVDSMEAATAIALSGTNVFSAAADKTLTVSGILTGTGALAVGDPNQGGTVRLGANAAGRDIRILGGTLEMTAATSLAALQAADGVKLVLPAVAQALSVGGSVLLDGVTVDVSSAGDVSKGLVLISAQGMSGTPIVGANLATAGWTLVAADSGNERVLKVVPTPKGTLFFLR